jgi:acetoin:2,6-dichlorophenolindophenol oxidoreductase subunit beta
VTYGRALSGALRHLLESDQRVVLLGEDIVDPYGGAFKVTRGLSTDFPGRVRATPVSEAAIAGISGGLALAGFRPVAEIMFGDFLGLCFDQIVNHVAKYGAMYDGGATCPVVIRTPMGGGRGYGPTHSQSLEKHFLGVPHLRVVAGSLWHDPVALFDDFLAGDSPVLHVEHKLLYPLSMKADGGIAKAHDGSMGFLPTVSLAPVAREECSLTVVAYGYQAELAQRVLDRLAIQEEIFAELLVPAELSPVDWAPLERSVAVTGSLLTVEEGTGGWSWGTELAAELGTRLFGYLRRPPRVLSSARDVIPSAADREADMLVGERQIEEAVRAAAA